MTPSERARETTESLIESLRPVLSTWTDKWGCIVDHTEAAKTTILMEVQSALEAATAEATLECVERLIKAGADHRELTDKIEALQSRLAVLTEALKPFADAAHKAPTHWEFFLDDIGLANWDSGISWIHLFTAAAALQPQPTENGK